MPLSLLLPDGAGALQQFSNGAGTVPTNVQTRDGNSSYRNTTTNARTDFFTCDDLPSAADKITNVNHIWNTAATSGTHTARARIRSSTPTNRSGANQVVDTGYEDYTENWATDADSTAWTVAKINSHQYGYETVSGAGSGVRVSAVEIQVTWVAKGGGFAYLVGSWIAPLIGAGTLSLGEIARILFSMRRARTRPWSGLREIPSSRCELEVVKAALARRPKFAL